MKGRYIYGKLNSEIQAVEYTGLPGEDGVSIKVDNEERTIEAQVDFNRFNYTPGESTNAIVNIDNENRTIAVDVTSIHIDVDDEISPTSENPVQNKIIYNALQGKQSTLTQTQLDAINSGIDSEKTSQIGANTQNISLIEEIIPNDATSQNQLASQSFVNSSIATNTAYFRGTYNIVDDLGLTTSATIEQVEEALALEMSSLSIEPTNNDYCFVSYPSTVDPTQIDKYDRYKYSGDLESWRYEYTLNNSSFTAAQWGAINSTITSGLVDDLQDLLAGDKTKTINNTSIIGSGNIDTKELYICTYGTTTYAEITTALSNGKLPVCFYDNKQYVYVGLSSTNRHTFSSQLFDTQRYVSVNSSDSWGAGNNNFEITSNKVKQLSSNSTDAQYPSAKCVYDFVTAAITTTLNTPV